MKTDRLTTREYLLPFILISSLFFLWGIAHGMLDTLNKHFQDMLELSKARSGMIQFSVYIAYFTMALPAGFFMKKYGYKKGIILGLSLFALGALLIAGTTPLESFWIFLLCLFILGCGLATLETAANPYTTKLGPKETAERRINFSQSFNGLAWVIGPLIGLYIYKGQSVTEGEKLSSMVLPYIIIASVVIAVAVLFIMTPLPEISEEENENEKGGPADSLTNIKSTPLMSQRHFVLGVIAQFSYVAAQTGIFSYLINFVTDENQKIHFDKEYGPLFLALGFALFMIGRMSGSYMMRTVKPTRILAIYALACVLLLPIVSAGLGWVSLISLFAVFFFMSIMFPTIFALGIKDLGTKTKKASSFIVMAIVGGAVFPPLMGFIADKTSMSVGFFAPIPFFLFILYYALYGYKIAAKQNN
ncbi:MAG TPA: L-fucose:H+ symporter permease [Bacteroidales bacterium]|nr:L-fucose:H+ symporter permease [Bacteroidales bacterium]HPI68303.1 L-fucose:H+ symporter permease [Bacteroidales bacterium]HPR72865.1 L-fucose:H+ symporter permease [Bacteroidales bacterium]